MKQLAFIAARQLYPVEVDDSVPDKEDLVNILNNNHLNSNFQNLAREVSFYSKDTLIDVNHKFDSLCLLQH